MKDTSTLKSLNRKLEVKFKQSQLHVAKIENILFQREQVEIELTSKIIGLQQELDKIRESQRSSFLAGKLNTERYREEQIQEEILNLKKDLLIANEERNVAQKRVEEAKLELETLYKEKEGFLRIEDERETQNERIKVETSDSN